MTRVISNGGPGVPMAGRSGASQGETMGDMVGSTYAVVLNERPNTSNNRNVGPTGNPSSVLRPLPVVTTAMRNTGRIA